MNIDLVLVLASILFLILGGGIGYFIRHSFVMAELRKRKGKADKIISKAKKDASEIKYNARRDAKDAIKEERIAFEAELKVKLQDIKLQEREVAKKEASLEQKVELHEKEIGKLHDKEKQVAEFEKEIAVEVNKYKDLQGDLAASLSTVAEMSREDAKNELLKTMTEEARADFSKIFRRLEDEANESAEKNSKKILSVAISRFAGEYVAERTIGSVELPSDEIKGRLIGREGRNIRAFEQICGVDLIIDDTPETVVISSFNVVRKEIARLTIEKLIADGRIHPAKIEEFHDKSKVEIDKQLRDLGEKAQMEIGVHGIHPEILKLVGALNWRTSYTQNQYQHAIETAFFCGALASELGMNARQARRAGLLHDVGKVIDASAEGSHALIGADFLKRYGESPDIVHAVRAHHEEEKPESALAYIVSAADALSGARPGARKAMMESYISRLTDIEEIVNSFEGVSSSYAISGGREVRVLVENKKVSDEQTAIMSHEIAKRIESEMTYPGTIKITVIRETKAIEVAR